MHIKAVDAVRKAPVSFKSNDIYKFSQVDKNLYRGGRPEPNQIPVLKDYNITTVVDFSTELRRIPNYSEKTAVENWGMIYHKLPFVSWENPPQETVDKFFEITKKVKSDDEKMFIHCLTGRDRTGIFTELYKIFYGLSDAQTSIATLIKSRYNFNENPLAIPFIKEFASKIHK